MFTGSMTSLSGEKWVDRVCCLATITLSLQLIKKLGTCRFYLPMPDLQMSGNDLLEENTPQQ